MKERCFSKEAVAAGGGRAEQGITLIQTVERLLAGNLGCNIVGHSRGGVRLFRRCQRYQHFEIINCDYNAGHFTAASSLVWEKANPAAARSNASSETSSVKHRHHGWNAFCCV
jgi:hypothetical protein